MMTAVHTAVHTPATPGTASSNRELRPGSERSDGCRDLSAILLSPQHSVNLSTPQFPKVITYVVALVDCAIHTVCTINNLSCTCQHY
jgi:hypothetical protein